MTWLRPTAPDKARWWMSQVGSAEHMNVGRAGGGRLTDNADVRWRVATEPSWHGRVRARALAGTRSLGPSWAAATRALLI
jgi:hypothetical protein